MITEELGLCTYKSISSIVINLVASTQLGRHERKLFGNVIAVHINIFLFTLLISESTKK